MPQPAYGIQLVKTDQADDTAVLRQGAIEIRVTGEWASRGGQTLKVRYRNLGSAVATVNVEQTVLSRGIQHVKLVQVNDFTGVNMMDQNPNNDNPRLLYDVSGKVRTVPLHVSPGETRNVFVDFSNTETGPPVDVDQLLIARIAVPGGTVPLRFKTAEG